MFGSKEEMTPDNFLHIINKYDSRDIVQLYLLDGFPYCFKTNQDLHIYLRSEVCKKFDIHPKNYAIVGSAQVGFSLSPDNFGSPFSDSSDIDIALISEELFQSLWLSLIEFRRKSYARLDPRFRKRFSQLQHILFWGILRLDKLSNDFDFAKTWWEFFNKLSVDDRFGPRRIRAALFKSWSHASFYYSDSIERIRDKHESTSD